MRRKILVFVLSLVIISMPQIAEAHLNRYSLQVGAFGDYSSSGNIGVQVEIQTNTYSARPPDLDYFWVGDTLDNGAFIQFGFSLEPGVTEPNATGSMDARWEWQYWPNWNGKIFYWGRGSPGSAGLNGTWHTYTITPNSTGEWSFLLDGDQVNSIAYSATNSTSSAYFIAEKSTDDPHFGRLGPVEFRNLAYLKGDRWHRAANLTEYWTCGVNTDCSVDNPYWIRLDGDHFVAGTLTRPEGLTLTLTSPSAYLVVDGKYYVFGTVPFSLSNGTHSVGAPSVVQLNSSSRLKFEHWNIGSIQNNLTINLESNMSLEPVYAQQYKLTTESHGPVMGDGWYDKGTTANFSTSSPQIFTGNAIEWWTFNGWYENGTIITTASSSSVVMNAPHTLVADWSATSLPLILPEFMLLVTVFLLAFLYFLYLSRRNKRRWRIERS